MNYYEHWKLEVQYRERRRAFRMNHKPVQCEHCKSWIMPANRIWTIAQDDCVFCSADCLAYHVQGYDLSFEEAGYERYFEKK